MATLRAQYRNYLIEHPDFFISFNTWKKKVHEPMVIAAVDAINKTGDGIVPSPVFNDNEMISPEVLGSMLFNIHSHYPEEEELPNQLSGKIIYYEEDVIALLKVLGLPEPKWGRADITIENYDKNK